MDWIARSWRGEERLWKVFWIYGFVLGWILAIFNGFIISLGVLPLTLLDVLFQIVYTVWILVAEWRCAFNLEWTFWGYFLRGLIALSVVFIPVGLIAGGILVGQDMIVAAECRKEVKDYMAQGGTDVESVKQKCIAAHAHK